MADAPTRLRFYISATANEIYDSTIQQAVDGIWSKSRIDVSRQLIQLKHFDRATGKFVDRDPRISFEDFTAEIIHGIRNSLHGYRMMSNAYERLLSIHSCEVSNLFPDLGTIYLFILLSDPDSFVRHERSKPLQTGRKQPKNKQKPETSDD